MAYQFQHLKKEKNYEFRRVLEKVHTPNRRDPNAVCGNQETELTEGWTILVEQDCSHVILNVAKDLQDYLLVSMNISVLLKKKKAAPEAKAKSGP